MKIYFGQYIVPFLAGVLAAVLIQRATGWWLNSGHGVAVTLVALFATALLLARLHPSRSLPRGLALWLGTMAAMTAILFWTGPGTIWPIVIVVAGALSGAAIGLGVLAGRRGRV